MYRIPEIILGVLLTVAVFTIGALVSPQLMHASEPLPHNAAGEPWKGLTDGLLVLFTAVLAAFTGLLWYSTNKLWLAGEKQYGLASDALALSQKNTTAAQQSAEASSDQAKIAREAFSKLERPYLLPQIDEGLQPTRDLNNKLVGAHIIVKVGNYGRTPAIVHYYKGAWISVVANEAPKIPFDELAVDETYNVGIVLAQSQTEVNGHKICAARRGRGLMESRGSS